MSKTVFISYRKKTGSGFARNLELALTNRGYDVFLDVDTIDAGRWADQIQNEVRSRSHFLLTLTEGTLERCASPNDWVRREYELARETKRNIVPVYEESFDLDAARKICPEPMKGLFDLQAAEIRHSSFAADVETLVSRFIPAHKAPPTPVVATDSAPALPQRIAPTRLTHAADRLFGRKREPAFIVGRGRECGRAVVRP